MVAILARDAVAGQALELLLQGAGYSTRLLVEPVADESGELLDGVRLLLLAPTLSTRYREAFLKSMRSVPATAKTPVLELVATLDAQNGQGGYVLWPCRIEELHQEIEAALLLGSDLMNCCQAQKAEPKLNGRLY
jgi:hypothetical protein